jgi:hypothetical protein
MKAPIPLIIEDRFLQISTPHYLSDQAVKFCFTVFMIFYIVVQGWAFYIMNATLLCNPIVIFYLFLHFLGTVWFIREGDYYLVSDNDEVKASFRTTPTPKRGLIHLNDRKETTIRLPEIRSIEKVGEGWHCTLSIMTVDGTVLYLCGTPSLFYYSYRLKKLNTYERDRYEPRYERFVRYLADSLLKLKNGEPLDQLPDLLDDQKKK